MNEQLAQEIAQLEEQAKIFKRDQDATTDEGAKAALQQEIDTVNAKIAARKQQIEAVETDVQATQIALINAFDQIDVDGQTYSLRDFTINEQFAQVLSAWFQLKAGEIAQQYSAQAQSYKQENDELKSVIEEKDSTITYLRNDNDRLGLSNADLQAKRDAAAEVIEEHEATIKRLTDDMSKLRDNVRKPAVTNMGGNLAELMKAALESRPAITNLRWEDENNRKNYLAEDAKTGETIRFGYLELGKYRQVTAEEASQFRQEAEQVEEAALPDLPLVVESSIEPPALPSEGEDGLELAEADAGTQVADEKRSVEERLSALEARVSFLEILK